MALSAPVTVTGVQPAAVIVKVAAPVLELSAATSTGWGRFQLADVRVTDEPDETDGPALPAVRATVTGMLAEGASLSETPNTSVRPWPTENEAGSACSVTPDPHAPPPELDATSVASTVAAV